MVNRVLKSSRVRAWSGALLGLSMVNSCTTAPIVPSGPAVPEIVYFQPTHPEGETLADLRAIFLRPGAPAAGFERTCDEAYARLLTATQSIDERRDGMRELVRREPLHYHWCFYAKTLALLEALKLDEYIDQRQKHVLDGFAVLSPMARAFQLEFKDSRYVKWAVREYRRLSEWIFYRKLDPSPELTSQLTVPMDPRGIWRSPAMAAPDPASVLDKYSIATATSSYTGDRAPAGLASPQPATEVSGLPPLPDEAQTTLPAIEPETEPSPSPAPSADSAQ